MSKPTIIILLEGPPVSTKEHSNYPSEEGVHVSLGVSVSVHECVCGSVCK